MADKPTFRRLGTTLAAALLALAALHAAPSAASIPGPESHALELPPSPLPTIAELLEETRGPDELTAAELVPRLAKRGEKPGALAIGPLCLRTPPSWPFGKVTHCSRWPRNSTKTRLWDLGKLWEKQSQGSLWFRWETALGSLDHRYYDPEMGRFITPDPLGYVDGPSVYGFGMNDPVGNGDPLGLNSGRSDGKEIVRSDRALVVSANREQNRRRYCEARVVAEDEAAEVDQEDWTNTAGAGLVGLYDTQLRFVYKARIEQHRDALQLALQLAEEDGDVARAFQIARVAVEGRNDLRTFSQLALSPGGRALSIQLEKPRPFDRILARYRTDNYYATLREVVEASGRSNRAVLKLAQVSRVLAPTATVLGFAGSGMDIYNAPEVQRERVVFREAGSLAGSAAGGTAGMWAGVTGGGAVLSAVGVANPPAGVIFGLALLGGGTGAYLGDGVGGWLGELLAPQYDCSDYTERE